VSKIFKEYLEEFIDNLLWFLLNPSYKNLKNVLKYFSVSYYTRRKIESTYWLGKDVRKTHADDF